MTAGLATPDAAFRAYLAVRGRLPQAPPRRSHVTVDAVTEIVGPFDVVLLDAYGVLNVGESPVPGAVRFVSRLRADGKRVMVVTNSAGYPKRVMLDRYARLGFDFAPDEVASSREALLGRLPGHGDRLWGLMLAPTHGTAELDHLRTEFLADDPGPYERVEGFLLLGSEGWSEARQRLLEAALRARPRPVLVGNPDLVAPREGGLTVEPGYFAHRLADRTGIAPEFLGKPFPEIFRSAMARLAPAPPPGRVLMVGDTLHTDILGGRAMGFSTALVTGYGSLAGADVAAAIESAGIVPDFVAGGF